MEKFRPYQVDGNQPDGFSYPDGYLLQVRDGVVTIAPPPIRIIPTGGAVPPDTPPGTVIAQEPAQ